MAFISFLRCLVQVGFGFHRMTAAFFQEGPSPDQMSNEIGEEKPVAKKNPLPRPSRMDHINDFFLCARVSEEGGNRSSQR